MDPFTLALIGGGLFGVGKSVADSAGRESDKKVQAETTRFSPWTGMKAEAPRKVDAFGNILKGGLSGATIANAGANAGWWGGAAGGTAGAAQAATGAGPGYQGFRLSDPDMYSSWPGMQNMSRGLAGGY